MCADVCRQGDAGMMVSALPGEMASVIGICVCAALCEQLLDKNRYFRAVRMVLGLQIAGVMVNILSGMVKLI